MRVSAEGGASTFTVGGIFNAEACSTLPKWLAGETGATRRCSLSPRFFEDGVTGGRRACAPCWNAGTPRRLGAP